MEPANCPKGPLWPYLWDCNKCPIRCRCVEYNIGEVKDCSTCEQQQDCKEYRLFIKR